MNIPSIKPDGAIPAARPKAGAATAASSRDAADVFKPTKNEKLLERIHAEPSVRPEVLERARALAADANYPPSDVMAQVAREVLRQIHR